jgi:acetylornithine/N-succinyldiaminopimelate aminotransferase
MISPVLPSYTRAKLSFVKGEGAWLVEADGRRFLDFGSGIAVMALGHGHPALVQALKDQADRLWHTSNLYTVPEQEALAERLVEHTFAETVFFCNSGTEAAELAIKMARKYRAETEPERTTILTFEGSFHGRSMAAISAAGVGEAHQGFRPAPAGLPSTPLRRPRRAARRRRRA